MARRRNQQTKTPPKRTKRTKRTKRIRKHERKARPAPSTPQYWLVESRWGWCRYRAAIAPKRGRRLAMEGDRIVDHLPKDLLRANPERQVLGYGCAAHVYGDRHVHCRRCRQPFCFAAGEQRYWYEALQIPRHVSPARCSACRRLERERKRGWPELMKAVSTWKTDDTPETRARVVRATHAVRTDVGPHALRRALGWARKLPDLVGLSVDLEEEIGRRFGARR